MNVRSGSTCRCIMRECLLSVFKRNDILDGTKGDLDKRVDERSELALTTTLCFRLSVASSRKDDGPEVNAVHILPVVHLLVRVLCIIKSRECVSDVLKCGSRWHNITCLALNFQAISEEDRELTDVAERMLVRHSVVDSV